jgi:7-cyano-7-deazaguanine synthase
MGFMGEKAILLFSGGIDSTTALSWGKAHFEHIQTLIFCYGQRHVLEVEMAKRIADIQQVAYQVVELPLKDLIHSALIDCDREIPRSLARSKDSRGIPHTYVPFRNGIFLAVAAAFAESQNIRHLITGFNVIDTPDYPDTTVDFTRKMEAAINQGTSASVTGQQIKIHTPFISKTKKDIIETGLEMGVNYSYSVSCYRGKEIPCLKCASCEIRFNAFSALDMEDPLIIRLKKEGRL